jgi:hypothetical protein
MTPGTCRNIISVGKDDTVREAAMSGYEPQLAFQRIGQEVKRQSMRVTMSRCTREIPEILMREFN